MKLRINLIYIILAVILISQVNALSIDNRTFNLSELPINYSVTVYIQGVENLTTNITYTSFLSGPNFLNFTANSTIFDINIILLDNISAINHTEYAAIEGINMNYSGQLEFYINIFNDTLPPDTDYIQTGLNSYGPFVICDYALPFNFTLKDISIFSSGNMTVYTNYNTTLFTVSPDKFNITVNQTRLVNVTMHLPVNLSKGNYTELVEFSIVSDFSNISFDIRLRDCIRPPPIYDDMITVCAIAEPTREEGLECQRLKAVNALAMYDAYIEAQDKIYINTTIEVQVNNTKYVPVLELDDREIFDAVRDCSQAKKLQIGVDRAEDKEMDEKDDKITELTDTIVENQETKDQDIHDTLQSLVEDMQDKDKKISEYEKTTVKKSKIWGRIIWGIIFASCIAGLIWYKNNVVF